MSNEGGVKIGVGFALISLLFRVCESAHAGFLLPIPTAVGNLWGHLNIRGAEKVKSEHFAAPHWTQWVSMSQSY